MSDSLTQVIKEEMSNVLQKADDVDLSDRERNDRLQDMGNTTPAEDRWYQTEESEGNVRDKLRQIVAEEYETLRDDPETSIEHRSGLRDFDIKDRENRDRWYQNSSGEVDKEKIKEVFKKATSKVLREARGDITTVEEAFDTARNLKNSLNILAADTGSSKLEKAASRLGSIIELIREEKGGTGRQPQVRNPR